MNRLTFLTGVLAACLVPAWAKAEPDLSTEQAIDQAWDELLKNPVAFFVQPGWELQRALGDLRDEFVRDAEDWQTARRLWCERSGQPEAEYPSEAVIQVLRDLPESVDGEELEGVLQSLPEDLFERLRAWLADWLQDEPDWLWEEDHFASWFRQQEGALEYFQGLGFLRDLLRELGVRIVEGEHPGSTYYAAELRLPIEEANRRARQLGIPVMFVDHDKAETNTAAEEGA